MLDAVTKYLRKFEKAGFILLAALCLTAILMNLEFNLLEANLYDFRMAHGSQSKADPEIALVTLDDNTVKALEEFSPLTLDFHARMMEALERMNPKAVGYLVDMNRVSSANPELLRSEWAAKFISAAGRLEKRGIPVLLGTPFDVTGEVVPPYPLSSLPHSVAVIHKDGNVFSEDKVTRRALTKLYDKPVFHVELAQKLGLIEADQSPRGSFSVPEIGGEYFFFRYHGDSKVPTSPHSDHPYQIYSFSDVLSGNLPIGALDGKIILVGTMTKEDSADFAYTPYNKSLYLNPKLGLHAQILDSIIHNDGIRRAPPAVNWAITFSVIAFVFWWVLDSTPLYGVFATLSLATAFAILTQALFSFKGIWLRESQPIVGIFIGYYLVVPYRLIVEYKKRWDYQRKNQLLVQVEELKTNFMSLITHDLKTPVARIQGLAEVLLKKAADRLVDRDKETLHSVISATDELNRFISSILELSKIESNRLHINLESKDLNTLVEQSIDGFKAQARAADIQIVSNLEPLFPIKLDASLISKVVNNLIDNALKYSPRGSKITIETREIDTWVVLSVRDQGIGMTEEEKKNLFTRFFRAKNDTTTKVTGTGLGLYLTKFFIEAHYGRVEIESEKNQGSTFKILLPLASGMSQEQESVVKPGLVQRWATLWSVAEKKKESSNV